MRRVERAYLLAAYQSWDGDDGNSIPAALMAAPRSSSRAKRATQSGPTLSADAHTLSAVIMRTTDRDRISPVE
jgi:hypothetical protein